MTISSRSSRSCALRADARGISNRPTNRSKKCLIEESGEVIDAIDNKDDANLCEELGDVLLQVVMHAQIAAEEGRFTIDDVIQGVSEKMVRRHPHVFGDVKVSSPEESLALWQEIKKKEKAEV